MGIIWVNYRGNYRGYNYLFSLPDLPSKGLGFKVKGLRLGVFGFWV